jgi:hypothetical protein
MYNINSPTQRSSSITNNSSLNGNNNNANNSSNSHVSYFGGVGTESGSDTVISTSREFSSTKSNSNSKFKF